MRDGHAGRRWRLDAPPLREGPGGEWYKTSPSCQIPTCAPHGLLQAVHGRGNDLAAG